MTGLSAPAAAALPSGVRGRLLALALALLAALLLWLGAVAPLRDSYADRAETLERQQTIARRMAALAQTLPAVQAAAEAAEARGTGHGETLLDGATDAVAAAALQQMLDELAGHAGLRFTSAEVMPAEVAGPYRAIAVRVNLTAPWPALIGLLQTIATAAVPMQVDNLELHRAAAAGRDTEAPIDVTFSVTGYRSGGTPGGGQTATVAP